MENPHQSDLTVRIYSALHALVDPALLASDRADTTGVLAHGLSRRFSHTWLVYGAHASVRAESFHADYLTSSEQARNCFLSVALLEPGRYCSSPTDVDLLVESLLAVNRVAGRKILLLAPSSKTSLGSHYSRVVESLADAPPDRLARGRAVGDGLTVDGLVEIVADWIAGL